MDEAAITGESIPVSKLPGDRVIAATMNKTGFFKMKADKTGENTVFSQIIRLVEDASASKAPIEMCIRDRYLYRGRCADFSVLSVNM